MLGKADSLTQKMLRLPEELRGVRRHPLVNDAPSPPACAPTYAHEVTVRVL